MGGQTEKWADQMDKWGIRWKDRLMGRWLINGQTHEKWVIKKKHSLGNYCRVKGIKSLKKIVCRLEDGQK